MKFKKKKIKKQRGSKTHGYGSMKKHRGAGNRGGRGLAGTGKRGDAKKPSINKKRYFGKYGFKGKKRKKRKIINIKDIEQILPKLVEKKQAEKKGNTFIIDLKKLGYDKLLSGGNVKNKLEIGVDFASKNAIEKIQKNNGKVNILKGKKAKKEKERAKNKEEPSEEKTEEKEKEAKE